MFDQWLFIFNPNLDVDFRGQLLLIYNVNLTILVSLEFSDCKLSIHMSIARFGHHLVSQFHDFD